MRYYDYFRSGESDHFSFFRMPKLLFTDPEFSSIPTDTKMLYGFLLDRMELSRRNGWVDEEGRVYVIFTVEEMMELLNRSKGRVIKMLKELDTSEEGIGLIERRRTGQGHPNIIYVKKFYDGYNINLEYSEMQRNKGYLEKGSMTSLKARPGSVQRSGSGMQEMYHRKSTDNTSGSPRDEPQEVHNMYFKKSTECTSGSPQDEPLEVHEMYPNNTNIKETDRNETDRSKDSAPSSASFYGSFHNVHLLNRELDELKHLLPYDWEDWIERLSKFMASSGRKYQNHFATICLWAEREQSKTKKREYNYPEGASL